MDNLRRHNMKMRGMAKEGRGVAGWVMMALVVGGMSAVEAQEPLRVKVVKPLPTEGEVAIELPGRTEAEAEVKVFSRATGLVGERLVELGDEVKAGQVLARIDVPEIRKQADAAREAVKQAEIRVEIARKDAARATALMDKQAISQEEAERREAELAERQAVLSIQQRELERLEVALEFAEIRAPFDGRVTARRIEKGDFVRGDASAATEWAFQVSKIDRLKFVVGATPDMALDLQKDTPVNVGFTELPGRVWKAEVGPRSGAFDLTSGTMRVELWVNNEEGTLPSGLSGSARFQLKMGKGWMKVPTNTLMLREGRAYLMVVEGGKLEQLVVLTGRNFGPQVEVRSEALSADDLVVVSPNALLKAGDAVIAEELPASPGK